MDTVYIVGDMFSRCSYAETILKHVKDKKRLVVGNHGSSWINKVDLKWYFVSEDNFLEISYGKHVLTICYYPLLSWKHTQKVV